MKTITEFAAITLKNAAKTRDELAASGKTPEELPAALGEALKLEGDKLAMLLVALELAAGARGDLKRVIVGALSEGEKAPSGAQDKDGKQFLVELYPPISAPSSGRPGRGEGRGDKRGGGRGDRKKGGKGGRGGGDRDRGGGGERSAGGGERGAGGGGRGPRRERAPRPEIAVQVSGGGGGLIRPKTATEKPAAAPAAEPPASEPSST